MARPKSGGTKQAAQTSQPLSSRIEKTRTSKGTNYVLDLKVNSPASLGYLNIEGLDSAPAMVRLSKVKGIDVIAITDLYSGEFIDPLVTAAEGSKLTVIPGVSLRCKVGTCDDVIISCLFPESTKSADIAAFLRRLEVPADAKGSTQFIVSQSLDQVLHTLESFNGVAIPTRIDKTPHRLAVLGELVDTYGFRAFDLAYADSAELFKRRWPRTPFRLFSFSDAYALAQIGSRTVRVKLNNPGFEGIKEIVARQAVNALAAR
jgi:hypothetical protein